MSAVRIIDNHDDVATATSAVTRKSKSTCGTLSTDDRKSDTKTSNAAAEVPVGVITAGHHQKPSSPLFRFVRGQDINSTFFSNNNNNNKDDSPVKQAKPFLVTSQLVWVCKSKGLKRNKKKRRIVQQKQQQRLEAFLRARIVHGDNEDFKFQNGKDCKDEANSGHSNSNLHADMVDNPEEEKEDRLLVRYPKGSTYMVKRNHLWPVLEPETIIRKHISTSSSNMMDEASTILVLVFAETNFYRRACMVHTLPDGADIFWEIGCDAGSTIHKVASTLNSSSSSNDNYDNESTCLRVLGIDKSQESIDEARRLYPHLPFCLWDVLAAEKKDNGNDTNMNSSSTSNNNNIDDDGDTANVPFASSLEQAIQDALAATSAPATTSTTASSLSTTPAPKAGTEVMQQQQQQQQQHMPLLLSPTVVAIDINGNRELPAVLACLNKVTSLWKPRLILVKSRALHCQLSLPQVEDATLAAMMMA